MEDLISKLNYPMSDILQVSTICRNLRPEVFPFLGATSVSDNEDLKQKCKIIEADIHRVNSENLPKIRSITRKYVSYR